MSNSSSMRILVTNDDGINAPGIQLLQTIASSLSQEVWVVAPETEQSASGHSLSIRRPLRIREVSPRCFAVDGTPTDAVLLAVKEIMKECRPDLILSGVNKGSNLGEDITYSGTVAAAMEGTLLDIPSIALSQSCGRDRSVRWDVPAYYAMELINRVMAATIPHNTLININFPDTDIAAVKGVRVTPQGRRKLGDNIYKNHDPEGNPYYWISTMRNLDKDPPGSDFAAVRNGYIAVTPIYLDFTNYTVIDKFNREFSTEFSQER